MAKVDLISVTSANFGFILNVLILIIWITGIFKTVNNPGIAQNVAAKLFLSTTFQVTKTSWFVVLVLIVASCSGNDHNGSLLLKPSTDLEILVNQFNNATPDNSNDLEKILTFKYYGIGKMHNIKISHKKLAIPIPYK